MKITRQARSDAKTLFRACRVDGVLDENRVRQAVTKVLAAKPRRYMAILQHFQRLVRLDFDRRAAVVESGVPLNAQFQQRITSDLTAKHGGGLRIDFRVAPELIGGLRIRVGSSIYDGSVAGRLAALAEQF